MQSFPGVHGRGRRTGERIDGFGRVDAPTVALVEIPGDGAEVVTVEPEVQLEVLVQLIEQLADMLAEFLVGERRQVHGLEAQVRCTQRRPDFAVPTIDHCVRWRRRH